MRWSKRETSKDIEDRRGSSGRFGGGKGIVALIIVLVGAYFGVDVSGLLESGRSESAKEDPIPESQDSERRLVKFVSFVLDDAQATWESKFAAMGKTYRRTKLVLYRRGTSTAGCGYGRSAIGPFYCPADGKIYLDFSFFQVLEQRLAAGGEFAQAYVLAHEIGHHIQNLLGTSDLARDAQRGRSKAEKNQLSVRIELQADCYAGIWAHATGQKGVVESGDIDDAIRAAKAIGDDTLQQNAGQRVREENFTHGSSAQRVKWFRRGQASGRVDDCDTFTPGR